MASYKGRTVAWNLCRGNHLGQRSCASAFTGRTYGRNDLIKTLPDPLRGGGRPHMGLGHIAQARLTPRKAWRGRRRRKGRFSKGQVDPHAFPLREVSLGSFGYRRQKSRAPWTDYSGEVVF